MVRVITIDGPGGVGKSTVASMLAERLQWRHLDTGAMYRAATLAVLEAGLAPEDEEAMAALVRGLHLEFRDVGGESRVLCNGRDVTALIRSPEVSRATSQVADVIGVRRHMVAHQRQIGLERPSVAEGRDMGTVVFPDAMVKFYIDAALDERARRRYGDLKRRGLVQSLDEVRADIERRDQRDRSRPYGALRIAPGAIVIDTTELTAAQVVDLMTAVIQHCEPADCLQAEQADASYSG
ncbi:MAG: (d)CMP kinase [Candidatus Sumerlaeia bacterium]